MSEPEKQRQLDVRIGSSTYGLEPVSVAERSLAAGPRQWAGLVAVAAAAIFADQLTKYIVTSELRMYESVQVLGPFTIHRVQNSGIAFGLFPSATSVVIVLTALAIGWMLVFFARSGARHPVIPAALGLLAGGSIANMLDRVRLGHVTDFLDIGWWPSFNLADTFIVLGVGLLIATLFLTETRPKRARRRLDLAR